MTDDDDKAKSIPKKPCNDNGPDLPDWEEQHDARTYQSGYGGASGTGTDQDQRAEELCR